MLCADTGRTGIKHATGGGYNAVVCEVVFLESLGMFSLR